MSKHFTAFLTGILVTITGMAQSVAINENGDPPVGTAILDLQSTTKGLLIPRMNPAQRAAIANTQGLMIYDNVNNTFWYNTGTTWKEMDTRFNWLLTGNTPLSTQFLGTTNNVPLAIRVNNQTAGRIESNIAPGGNNNTFLGYQSGFTNAGIGNTAIGTLALSFNSSGQGNVAIGNATMTGNTTGSSNTAIGSQSNVSANGLSNATVIGAGATVDASNKVRIGNAAVTVIEGQVGFTTPSDGRFKFNIQEDIKGLEFITRLRPVSYQFDVRRFDEQVTGYPDSLHNTLVNASYEKAAQLRRSGFIAQEVEKAALAAGFNFSGLVKPSTEKGYYTIHYDGFVMPLVKAIQEQQQQIEELKTRIKQLEKPGGK